MPYYLVVGSCVFVVVVVVVCCDLSIVATFCALILPKYPKYACRSHIVSFCRFGICFELVQSSLGHAMIAQNV